MTLEKKFPGIRIFGTAYTLPMDIVSSSAAMIFKLMLNPTVGIINKIFNLSINWFTDPDYALFAVAILTAWLNSGINFLYFSAGLGNIDESLYERTSIDGASAVQKFFRITLPGLLQFLKQERTILRCIQQKSGRTEEQADMHRKIP